MINHIEIFQNSILPKFLSNFQGKQKLLWQSFINKNLPKQTLNYSSEEEYLKDKNITKKNVIINSIKFIDENISPNNLEYLANQFDIFSKNCKIKIIYYNFIELPIYTEIIDSLEYIQRINELLKSFPKYYSDYLGTKFRQSSYKTLLKTQLTMLKNRLNGNFFNLTNNDEIEKTKKQMRFIELALTEKFKNIPHWFNFAEIYLGLDNKFLNMTAIEIQAIKQLNTFFNGIKTSKEELLKSVSIFLKIQSKIQDTDLENHKLFAENIMNILRLYFDSTIHLIQKERNNKREFTYSKANITKDFTIKTYINETPIYIYNNQNTNDHFMQLFIESLNGIAGLSNIFQEDKPTLEEINEFTFKKNILLYYKELGLTSQEIKSIIELFK